MISIGRLTYKVGAPIPVTGVQFGARVEFGVDCLIPADFNNDVSKIHMSVHNFLRVSKFEAILYFGVDIEIFLQKN